MVDRRNLDLLAVAALTIIAATVVLTSFGGSVIRVAFGVPLALLLPGYALTAALFPRSTMGLTERLAITLGIGLAALAVIGVALNWTRPGLTPATWSLALTAVTLVAVLIAVVRRRGIGDEPFDLSSVRITGWQWATFGAAALVLTAAILIARAGALDARGDGFTQLSMVPLSHSTRTDVQIGVTNRENSSVGYVLELVSGGQMQTSWTIELRPGETWQTTTTVERVKAGTRTSALLYRLDAPQVPYRQVALAGAQ